MAITRRTGWFQDAVSPLTVTIAAGDALAVWVYVDGLSGATTVTVSDNASGGTNSYTNIPAATIYFASHTTQLSAFYCTSAKAGGATSVTYTALSGTPQAIWIDVYTGVATSSPLDGTGAAANPTVGAGTDAITTGVWTTSSNGDVICAMAATISGGTPTKGSVFTLADDDSANGNLTEYMIQAAASASTAGIFTSPTGGTTPIVSAFALSPAAVSLAPQSTM